MDYVPALCTHRPSHLPIGWSGEIFGFQATGRKLTAWEKLSKPYYLEEGEVVTRLTLCEPAGSRAPTPDGPSVDSFKWKPLEPERVAARDLLNKEDALESKGRAERARPSAQAQCPY